MSRVKRSQSVRLKTGLSHLSLRSGVTHSCPSGMSHTCPSGIHPASHTCVGPEWWWWWGTCQTGELLADCINCALLTPPPIVCGGGARSCMCRIKASGFRGDTNRLLLSSAGCFLSVGRKHRRVKSSNSCQKNELSTATWLS